MNKTLTWIIIAIVVILLLILLAVLPVRRGAEEIEAPRGLPGLDVTTPAPTALPTPSPEVLTPEKELLSDLEAETGGLEVDRALDADLQALDTELRGI